VIGINHGMPSTSPSDTFAEHTPAQFEIFKFMIPVY
jgi:hypothetical protein